MPLNSAHEGYERAAVLDDCPVVAHRNDKGLTVCDFSLVNRDTLSIPFSMLSSQIEIVRLEYSKMALAGNDCRVFASENHVGIYSHQVNGYKLYRKDGKYLRTVATRGKGPNEFLFGIYDSYIDEKEGKIYLLPGIADKILVFDFQGNALTPIPLAYTVPKGKFKIDARKKTLTMTVLPFRETPSVVWVQDFDGKILQEIPSSHLVIDPGDYSNEVGNSMNISDVMDFSLFHWVPVADSLYRFEEATNTLIPVFTASFKENVMHGYTELPGYYLVQLFKSASPTYSPPVPTVLIDKQSLKGSYVKWSLDILGDIVFRPQDVEFNRGYLNISMHPLELKEKLENRLKQTGYLDPKIKDRITKLNNSITDNDNNIIILGKLKPERE